MIEERVVGIDDVKLLSPNPRKHSDLQIQEMEKSLAMFGQYRPLVLDEKMTVLAGNGLLIAMRRAGFKEARAYVVKGLSKTQRSKLILSDNRLAQLSADDYDVVEEMLREIGDFEVPGYDSEVLQELLASMEEVVKYAEDYGRKDPEQVTSAPEAFAGGAHVTYASDESENAPGAPSSAAGGGGEHPGVCPTCNRPWL